MLADRFLHAHRSRIVEFASAQRLPGMYPYREYVDAGGLMSYAPNNIELFRGAAEYVDRILKGARPSDLPVQEPTKFDFVISLKTAHTVGITIPPSLRTGAELAAVTTVLAPRPEEAAPVSGIPIDNAQRRP